MNSQKEYQKSELVSLGAIVICALFSAILITSASAQTTTYNYTGNPYVTLQIASPTLCPLNGSFTTAQPIPPNLSGTQILNVTSYTFNDCVSTLSSANAAAGVFDIQTDNSGRIIAWFVDIYCLSTFPQSCLSQAEVPIFPSSSCLIHYSYTSTSAIWESNHNWENNGANVDNIHYDDCADLAYAGTWTTANSCPQVSVAPYAGGNNSQNGRPTAMIADFSPTTQNGDPVSLTDAASACGYAGFNWQQSIDYWPPPSTPTNCFVSPSPCLEAALNPTTVLSAPPAFPDPPAGGYTYNSVTDVFYQAFPFYYDPTLVPTGCAESINDTCITPITSNDGNVLNFFDSPRYPLLTAGGYMGLTTSLVGVLSNGTAGPALYTWSWITTYNGTTGGAETASYQPVDGSGTGGVTITSINGVQQNPPSATCAPTPTTLWPPNGKTVPVTVSGTIVAGTQTLISATYAVIDSYGQDQPSGVITLAAGGKYSFAVPLIASRNGNDINGRTYSIVVRANDAIGNVGTCSAIVTVPHDQGNN